ncbi:MAG: T9SS type A sorting domain-containing protein [Bacteroidia bacterium]|nr:T9SS type A sorting domain-containing protein [Bacteroidia bacterium]
MRLLIILFVFTTTSNCWAQWKKINTGTSNDLYDVQSISENAFVCGQSSKILISKDSGKSWKSMPLSIPSNLRCLYFFDSLHGMVSGENARLQMTYNGGKTWTQKYVRTAAYAYDITFSGANGLMVGNNSLVVSSNNNGESWTVDTTPSIEKQLNNVAISKGGICWAVGDSGIILRKLIHQKSWIKINSNTKVNLTHVSCFSDSIIIISGGMSDPNQVGVHYNVFLKSNDSGKTWSQSIIPEMKSIFAGYFFTPDSGFLCGSNGIICKIYHPLYKRGQQLSGTASILNSITYSDNYGLIAGDGGTILRTTNMGGYGLTIKDQNIPEIKVYPNPSSDIIYVETKENILSIQLISNDGISTQVNLIENTIDIEEIASGQYWLIIKTQMGVTWIPILKY